MADVVEHPGSEQASVGAEAHGASIARSSEPPRAPHSDGAAEDMALDRGLHDGKPSIAVLPFINLNQDPEQEYFSYGLTQDIIRLLGRNRWLAVLSRQTVPPGQTADHDPRDIGAALGVRYVVKGSVRRSGERVRIAVDLIAAADGTQLWSEAYDIELVDIFEIQEAMAQQICAVIEPELASVEQRLAALQAPESLDAWHSYQRGFWHLWGFTNPGFDEAAAMFSRAIDIEPGFARAHAGLSYVHLQKGFYGDPAERAEVLRKALALAQQAVALDERDSYCRCVLGRAHFLLHRFDDAVAELEAAIELNPSFAQGYFALGFAMAYSGREDEGIALLERAAELSPRDPHTWTFHHTRAIAHFSLGELKSAEFFARKSTRQRNATHYCFATLMATLGLLGQKEEARSLLPELQARKPDYSLWAARDGFFFCTHEPLLERYVAALREVGIAK